MMIVGVLLILGIPLILLAILAGRRDYCRTCGDAVNPVPISTPRGQEIIQRAAAGQVQRRAMPAADAPLERCPNCRRAWQEKGGRCSGCGLKAEQAESIQRKMREGSIVRL